MGQAATVGGGRVVRRPASGGALRVVLACVAICWSCSLPPKHWDVLAPDGSADADQAGPDGDADLDVDGSDGDAEEPDADATDADPDPETPPEGLCDGVICFPDEQCDPWTGECTSEGLDCSEIVECWIDAGIALPSLLPCLLEGSAEGRRDFTDLFTCLLTSCISELFSGGDLIGLALCAAENCPDQLAPCAEGFF